MTCCGVLVEITTQDDRTPVFICQECGKQGLPSAFPDERPTCEPQSFSNRIRWRIAEWLSNLVVRIAPK
jgi:hypothetical protein